MLSFDKLTGEHNIKNIKSFVGYIFELTCPIRQEERFQLTSSATKCLSYMYYSCTHSHRILLFLKEQAQLTDFFEQLQQHRHVNCIILEQGREKLQIITSGRQSDLRCILYSM